MHRPIYTSSTAGVIPTSVLRVAEDLQQALESAFVLYQVPYVKTHATLLHCPSALCTHKIPEHVHER